MTARPIPAERAARSVVKRLLDIVVSVAGLLVLSPLLLVIAVGILLTSGTPVFFRQVRPGLSGKPFVLVKFRTMRRAPSEMNEGPTDTESDMRRTTPLGRVLRSTSLDELPELWNVLLGQMSLVGPRPLLMEYLPLYSERQARRHSVRPGITGWAQVNGRNALSWEERFEYDLWYVENWSLILDFKILVLTVRPVFTRQGIDASGETTMEPFRGTNSTGRDGGSQT